MTILGVDFGLQRTGLAFSNADDRVAFPGPTLTGAEDELVQQIAREAASRGASEIVVGLPRHLNGSDSEMSVLASVFAANLRRAVPVKVVTWDERLTSRQADRAMLTGDLSRKKRKKRIDALAAQLMLQNYLDSRLAALRQSGPKPGTPDKS